MLTLQFVPYSEIENLDSGARINKLLNIVKGNRIVLMQGRLEPEEETQFIQHTMSEIKDQFKGVEICTIFPEEKNLQPLTRIKKEMIKFLLGNREGITIIGPATIIKDIKRDPNKILLLAHIPKSAKKANSKKTKSKSKKAGKKFRRR